MKVVLLASPNSNNVANAARLCYSKSGVEDLASKHSDESNERFISMLADMGHESPLEHANFTFGIEGVSRSLTHQLVRHRIASFSQQSQRYVRVDESFDYITPRLISESTQGCNEIYAEHMDNIYKVYDELVTKMMVEFALKSEVNEVARDMRLYDETLTTEEQKDVLEELRQTNKKEIGRIEKIAIENARYILPNATETKIVMTMNARSLRNFFELRCCVRAQEEIRKLAYKMLALVKESNPELFKDSGPRCVGLGYCPEGNMSCGNYLTKEEALGGRC